MKAPQKNRRRRCRHSWIDLLMIIVATLVVVADVIIGAKILKGWQPNQVADETTTRYVQYEVLNVRASPWGGEILSKLYRGDTVELTGNSKEFYGGDSDLAVWQEISLADGTTGWVVGVALVNADQYQKLFGG